eukprot:SAG11_NODE_220_length_12154_cov_92.233347_5_plen_55_part_00
MSEGNDFVTVAVHHQHRPLHSTPLKADRAILTREATFSLVAQTQCCVREAPRAL